MSVALAVLLSLPCGGALPAFQQDQTVELRYTGGVAAYQRGGLEEPAKTYNGTFVVTKKDGGGFIDYQITETGTAGQWPWPERFGRVTFDAELSPTNKARPQLLYEHNGTKYPVDLRSPLFEEFSKLAEDAVWKSGRLIYEVRGQAKVDDEACWIVDVRTDTSHRERVWISTASPIVVRSERRVFMGRGDRFLLTQELASAKTLSATARERVAKAFETFHALKTSLERRAGETKPELSTEQLGQVRTMLDRLKADSKDTPLASLATTVAGDYESQVKRFDQVAALAKKIVGRPAPPFELTTLAGEKLDSKKLRGRIVVLHFWTYSGEPLEEPYGQVGYLDFLNGKRHKLGVDVIGVAVNEEFGTENARAALRSVRKLREFMNLDYPIATDNGTLLKAYGDPRSVDGKLPLWVVIDHSGDVAHYHAGFYAIKPNEGLKQLDAVLIKLIRKRRDESKGK
jgi:peroxiredoxin